MYTTLDRSDRCVELCLEFLNRIDVHWSPHPTEEQVRAEYDEIWRRIGLEGDPSSARVPADAAWGEYPGGVPVVKGDPLFPRRKG